MSEIELLAERLAEQVRQLIATEALASGTRIRERELAERLAVSRTPLRDALKLLAADGLVTISPKRGAVVASMSPGILDEKLEVLAMLEGHAGQLAAERAAPETIAEIRARHFEMRAAFERSDRASYFAQNQGIHLAIVAASGNATLAETHARINRQLFRYRFNGSLTPSIWATAMDEHETIIRLLTDRDGPALNRMLALHVGSTWRSMREVSAEPVPSDRLLND